MKCSLVQHSGSCGQDETTSVDAPYVVDSLSYDAYGPVADAGSISRSTVHRRRDLKRLLPLQKETSITSGSTTSLLNTMVMTLMEMSRHCKPSQAMMKEMEKHPQAVQNVNEDWEEVTQAWVALGVQAIVIHCGSNGLADVATRGTTESGLESNSFSKCHYGTAGCARSKVAAEEDTSALDGITAFPIL